MPRQTYVEAQRREFERRKEFGLIPSFQENHALSDTFSYSGSDVLCLIYIPGSIAGEGFIQIEDKLQTVTVSSARSVSPVRRLGETTPNAYARGSRTIAGSMVFTTGLRDAFVDALGKVKKANGIEPKREPVLFIDQMPKFSMVLQANNELGGVSTALLVNITLTNFGTTFSIDDIYTESTFTYVAEQYYPLSKVYAGDTGLHQGKVARSNEIMNLVRQGLKDVEQDASFLDPAGGDLNDEERLQYANQTNRVSRAPNRKGAVSPEFDGGAGGDIMDFYDRIGANPPSITMEQMYGKFDPMQSIHAMPIFDRSGGIKGWWGAEGLNRNTAPNFITPRISAAEAMYLRRNPHLRRPTPSVYNDDYYPFRPGSD